VLGGISPRLPFWVAGGLTLLNALYGLFVLPESCPTERRKAFSWKRANPIGAVVLLSSHRELLGLSAVHFLYLLAHQALPSVFVLYAGYRYGWGERDVGLLLALIGICSITVQGALVRPTVARIGERWALVAGLLFGAGVFAFYGLATAGYMLWLGAPVFALMGLFDPPLQALLTRRVDPSQQGQLQGANSSLMGITGLIGPILFTQIFAYCIKSSAGVGHWGLQLPGAPFLLGAALLLSAIVVAWYVFSQPADSN
jgi:DHA1 family tetracycline resistance protein-like MFS transporter